MFQHHHTMGVSNGGEVAHGLPASWKEVCSNASKFLPSPLFHQSVPLPLPVLLPAGDRWQAWQQAVLSSMRQRVAARVLFWIPANPKLWVRERNQPSSQRACSSSQEERQHEARGSEVLSCPRGQSLPPETWSGRRGSSSPHHVKGQARAGLGPSLLQVMKNWGHRL